MNRSGQTLAVSKKYIRKARFQFIERMLFMLIPTAQGRVKWLRKHNKFAMLGEHVHYQPRKYPVAGGRVKIHNNVVIAADVEFTGHDIIHWVFDGIEGKRTYKEYHGCIEIYDNCFIGAGARILPNVSIGPNSIVAAGAVVNRDVPPGTVVGGVPAKVIGSFDDIREKRMKFTLEHSEPGSYTTEALWKEFYEKHR